MNNVTRAIRYLEQLPKTKIIMMYAEVLNFMREKNVLEEFLDKQLKELEK